MMRFAIIGAGMSGILAAIKLKQMGQTEVTVYEKADALGGTWRDNRYPGLACDVPSHAYTYEFAPNPEWSAYLVGGAEIKAYFDKVTDDFGIRDTIRFNSEVVDLRWGDGRWHLKTADGHTDVVDAVIAASGVLHHPNVPQIEGMETFKGRLMHTAQWDTSVSLEGKRIGVVGNGSTGVQMVAHLALEGHDVTHIQRSPQWIMPFDNHIYTEEEKAAFRADIAAIDAVRYDPQFLYNVDRFANGITDKDSSQIDEIEGYCRMFLEAQVTDEALREKLRPNYRAACKRLIYSSTYYAAIQKPNATLCNEGVARIVREGIIDNAGQLHELDIIALATGFHADKFIRPTQVVGLDGASLDDVWKVRCAAYLGMAIPGFPNLFFINGPTSPVGNFSLIDIAERQWNYVEQLIQPLVAGDYKQITVKASAFEAHEAARVEAHKNTVWSSGCSSWYLDSTGVPITWPWTYDHFREVTKTPDLKCFETAR